MRKIDLECPIPIDIQGPDPKIWKNISIKTQGKEDELVALGPFSEFSEIYTDAIYAGQRINSPYHDKPLGGSLITITTTKRDAKRLQKAQSLLPEGLYLVALDIFRPLEVQQSLFDSYYQELKNLHLEWTEEKLLTETQKYVSLPSRDQKKPSPHNTARSADVAIFKLPIEINEEVKRINFKLSYLKNREWVNRVLLRPKNYGWREIFELEYKRMVLKAHHGEWLNFGTPFDWGGEEAALNYYEISATNRLLNPQENKILQNRRLLYNVMTHAGFQPYLYEWWHYNAPESQMGAQTANLAYATSGARKLSVQNQEWEATMKKFHKGIVINWRNKDPVQGKARSVNEITNFVRKVVLENKDPEFTIAPPSCGITPK